MSPHHHITIIGGGIIGLSSAWYLNEAGYQVTIIDQSDLEDGTSHGNAGMIVPSHFVPLAAPGVIQQGLKWMLNSKSPFYIKPRLSLELAQWVWHFYRSCTEEKVQQAMPILQAYNEWSKELYQDFSNEPAFDFCFEKKGLLMLYQSSKVGKEEIEMAEKAHALGLEAKILSATEVQALETGVELDVAGGVYYPGDAHLYPNLFIGQLQQELIKRGVKMLSNTSITDFRIEKGQVSHLQTQDGAVLPVQKVLVSAGSWSAQLLKKLGLKILLQDGKGYSVTLKRPSRKPIYPTILTEAKVAITPMGEDLRVGGTLELSNLSPKVNRKRLQGILESVPKYYPGFEINAADLSPVWHGYRPCTPDGLPFMGAMPSYKNLFLATGHAMMGMSLGPATGKLMAEMIQGQKTGLDVSLFAPDRF
ncbi:MAG: FAD-dependent oxidoreductase [Bacteroidota bacterium]